MKLEAQVPLILIHDIYEVESSDGSPVCFHSDLEKTADGFERQWPGSGRRYVRFVRKMESISHSLRPMLQTSQPGALSLIQAAPRCMHLSC